MNWPQIKKKNHNFEVLSSVILCNSNRPFLDCIVMYDEKWIIYHNWQWPAQWLDREEAPKHFPKPNLRQKRSWSLFDGLLPIWSTTALWVPVKPLHLRSMLSKSMRCTENCNACNRHWSTERNQFSMTMPIHTLHNQCLKSGANWPIKFCLIYHICPTSHQLIITSLSNILRGKCFHNQ